MARKKITGTVAAISLVFVMAILIEELIDNDDTKDRDRYRVGDYTLEIFGNANGDWYIDHDDVAFLKRIIVGEEEETVFADANRDGALDAGDVEQVNRIIAGTANAVWIVDGNGNPVKVNLPVRRIGVEYLSNAELMNVLGVSDRVMAADAAVYIMKDVYFPGRELLNMGQMHQNPDFETITGMELDILFTFSPYDNELKQEKLPGTDVVFLGLYRSNVIEPRSSRFLQGVLKAGYILGASGRAYDYMEWLLGIVGRIGSVTSSLPEEARPSVLMTSYNRYFADSKDFSAAVYTRIDPLSQACILAGGKPIAEDLDNWIGEGNTYGIIADLEWIIERDPRFIFVHSVRAAYNGLTRKPNHGYDCNDPGPFNRALADMKKRPLLADLSAVDSGGIYIIAGDFRNNAMGGILGAVYLAGIIHTDLFPDLDPRAVHQEFISRWMGLDYDLGYRGVFIAPAAE